MKKPHGHIQRSPVWSPVAAWFLAWAAGCGRHEHGHPQSGPVRLGYVGGPHAAAIKHGNHRLLFQTTIKEEGLSLLADALVANGDIKENPGKKLYADAFKGITWGK